MRRIYTPNFDGKKEAAKIRADFYAKPPSKVKPFPWDWPKSLVEVGDCRATLYRSDKWNKKGKFIDYKHNSEAEQRLYIVPSKISDIVVDDGHELVGPTEHLSRGRMPKFFAELALFMGFQAQLYRKDGSEYYLPDGDDGFYEIHQPHAYLGAGECADGTKFLVSYSPKSGPWMFVFGVELDIEKDGIVG